MPTLARSLDARALRRATRAATEAFFAQARRVHPDLADELEGPTARVRRRNPPFDCLSAVTLRYALPVPLAGYQASVNSSEGAARQYVLRKCTKL